MPLVKRVTLIKNENCSKCHKEISAGNIAVKDRMKRKEKGETIYYHTKCP
jgi:hypothetical protein